MRDAPSTTFALIHGGGGRGAWWSHVVEQLHSRGHRAVAPDLPIEDPACGGLAYARVVADAIGDDERPTVVVGHSLGGLTVPLVTAVRPVSQMVFLGALVPSPGQSFRAYAAAQRRPIMTAATRADGFDRLGRRAPRPWSDALAAYYHDCDEATARRAWATQRPQSVTVMTETCPLAAWPPVPGTYVLMREDRSIDAAWARSIAAERLDGRLLELPGGHSPFLSRPREVAELLIGIAGGA
jgi:pimeloyl-ACP methyl ester carboxylesterase